MKSTLAQHRFQYVGFCPVHHPKACGGGLNINDDHHALHIIRGTGSVTINKTTYPLARGTVVAVPPFVEFVCWVEDDFVMQNIHYRLWSADGEPIERRWMLPLVFIPDYFDRTQSLLSDLCELDSNNVENQAKTTALAHEIVLDHWLHTNARPIWPEIIDHRIEKLHDILVSPQYLRGRYDAQELAHECHLSISQMGRLFKRTFKCTPQKFWEDQRLAAICVAFDTKPDAQTGEIAYEFGFEDPAYFSRWFKQRAGLSPATYRQHITSSQKI